MLHTQHEGFAEFFRCDDPVAEIQTDAWRGVAPRGPNTACSSQKKRPHKAGVKSLRQVSYRQETYRAVP